MIDIDSMQRYVSPVNPAVFPHLTVVLLGIGIFFTAWFFVYEVTSTKFTRDIFKELLVALVAAIFSGFALQAAAPGMTQNISHVTVIGNALSAIQKFFIPLSVNLTIN
ncbi:Transmembrane protein 258 [Gryllus bimaculatus]|nr:Transmembrane protein 258 [Gryllus bimaculatus]